MYPHPDLNSFLRGCNTNLTNKTLDDVVHKAILTDNYESVKTKLPVAYPRLISSQPQCYGPNVDVTRAKCGFGAYALPQLKKDLRDTDLLTVRKAVTTLEDLVINPEKLMDMINLQIPEELTDFLLSSDPYLRERVAIIYSTLANYDKGRKVITDNLNILLNLSKGLDDKLAIVRLKMARVLEILARNIDAADLLINCDFPKFITKKLKEEERNEILIVLLDTLKWLLQRTMRLEDELFDRLLIFLDSTKDRLVEKSLICLKIACESCKGKQMANERDLLAKLKKFLYNDKHETLIIEALRVASFVTITTTGKLCAFELGFMSRLLYFATKTKHYCCLNPKSESATLLLPVMKTLTNIAEVPEARNNLSQNYVTLIEAIDVGKSELLQRHKKILLDVILWQP